MKLENITDTTLKLYNGIKAVGKNIKDNVLTYTVATLSMANVSMGAEPTINNLYNSASDEITKSYFYKSCYNENQKIYTSMRGTDLGYTIIDRSPEFAPASARVNGKKEILDVYQFFLGNKKLTNYLQDADEDKNKIIDLPEWNVLMVDILNSNNGYKK